MTCEVRGNVFVCSRGPWPAAARSKCDSCGTRPALFECDYPDPSRESGTCDRRICSHRDCLATRWGKNSERLDICRSHVTEKVEAGVQ